MNNKYDFYYMLILIILCSILTIIFIRRWVTVAKRPTQEPRIVITQLPSFSLSKNQDITISYSSPAHFDSKINLHKESGNKK